MPGDILYFAWVRERIGQPGETVVTAAKDMAALVDELWDRDERHADAFADIPRCASPSTGSWATFIPSRRCARSGFLSTDDRRLMDMWLPTGNMLRGGHDENDRQPPSGAGRSMCRTEFYSQFLWIMDHIEMENPPELRNGSALS